MARTGYITGLVSEGDCLLPLIDRSNLRVAGIGPGAAERCARDLIAQGCDLLVSFGLAGGLAPGAVSGGVAVAEAVVAPDGQTFLPHPEFTEALIRSIQGARSIRLAGCETILATPDAKNALQRRTSAAAVDMETHHIARCAEESGISFVAVRAIADPPDARLPDAALHAVDETGIPDIKRVIGQLARRPWDLIALLKLAAYSRAAHQSLRRVAPVVVGCANRL